MFADAHCDTITRILDKKERLYRNSGHIDLSRLAEQSCVLQYFAVWIDPCFEPHYAFDRFLDVADKFYSECEKNSDTVTVIKNASDLDGRGGKMGALLTIEGGGAIGKSLSRLRAAYRLGVRCMTLTWNGRNDIADGVFERDGASGLSVFGKRVVDEMNELNMIIDVSHLSDRGFYDVAERSKTAFIASHSDSRTECNHIRNLTDEQIKHLVSINGYIGLNLCSDFLHFGGSEIADIIRHTERFLSLGCENILGFGADFDGVDVLPHGVNGVQNMNDIINELCKMGYSDTLINKLCYGNLVRCTKEILKN